MTILIPMAAIAAWFLVGVTGSWACYIRANPIIMRSELAPLVFLGLLAGPITWLVLFIEWGSDERDDKPIEWLSLRKRE